MGTNQPSYNNQAPYPVKSDPYKQQPPSNYGGNDAPQSNYNNASANYGQSNASPQNPGQYGAPPPSNYGNASLYGGAGNSGPIQKSNASSAIVCIDHLNPYSGKWTIKARVTSKSDMRTWSNAKGNGHLFSVDLLDSQGGEIRGTFFKETADKFKDIIQEGSVYTISGGQLKMIQNKQYNNLKSQYEITFNNYTEIAEAEDDGIKTQSFNFVKIGDIANVEINTTIDVLAIVKEFTEVSEITSTKMGGKVLHKRELTLVDDSECEVRLTLWGEKAQATYNWQDQPVIAVKGVRVGDFGGRSLSISQGSSLSINPLEDVAKALHEWRRNGIPVTKSLSTTSNAGAPVPLDQREVITGIKDKSMGMGEKPDYTCFKGTITYIKHDNDPWYNACPAVDCNKKVIENMGGWHCEKCNKTHDTMVRRFILSVVASDHTGQQWVSLFNDTATKMLGCSADALSDFKNEGNDSSYEKAFSDAQWKTFTCKVRVKQEMVQDEPKLKVNVMALDEINYDSECKQMIDAIAKYQ